MAAGAPLPDLQERPPACSPDDECVPGVAYGTDPRPTVPEVVDPRIEEIFLADDSIRTIVAGRQLGQDYWMRITPIAGGPHGDEGGMVTLAFSSSISYDGELPIAESPCEPTGVDESIPADDPCLLEARIYTEKQVSLKGITLLYAQVDTKLGRVVTIFGTATPAYYVTDVIRDFKGLPPIGLAAENGALSSPASPQ